jgi:hypothetical protein
MMILILQILCQPIKGQTLGFIVEEAGVSVTKTRTENCASLIFELKIAQTDVLSSFSTLKTLATDWKALPKNFFRV